MDYTPDFLIRIIEHFDLIDSFLTSTTSSLVPSHYNFADENSAFFEKPGHTLWNTRSMTTRVASKGGFRENLMIWRADLDRALGILSKPEYEAVLLLYYYRPAGRPPTDTRILALDAIQRMAEYLNGEAAA